MRLNTDFIRSVPKRPIWPMSQLGKEFSSHDVNGETFIDLRGFTFYELRHMRWDHVDMSGALFYNGVMTSGLIGTGSIGSIVSSFHRCLFSCIDASHANVEGVYEDCDFVGAKMKGMNFFVDARFRWRQPRSLQGNR